MVTRSRPQPYKLLLGTATFLLLCLVVVLAKAAVTATDPTATASSPSGVHDRYEALDWISYHSVAVARTGDLFSSEGAGMRAKHGYEDTNGDTQIGFTREVTTYWGPGQDSPRLLESFPYDPQALSFIVTQTFTNYAITEYSTNPGNQNSWVEGDRGEKSFSIQ
jgi:hypothetical protein